jgi:hypothetical protein
MARFSEYIDTDDYLPGDVYSAGLSDYQLYPQLRTDYVNRKRWKFQPKEVEDGTSFQTFLALQSNPKALFKDTVKMPNTPFGNLSQYMDI